MTFRACCLMIGLAAPGSVHADQTRWDTFNGTLSASKFADVTSITPDNVAELERAWEVRTGDVSDGTGELPETVWSATPIYANGTLYLGTPFYRILALDPATGQQRWSYDSRSTLEALTQPALKNRGVAYWESGAEGLCEKRVYLGTMDATLHAVDADTGTLCEDFGQGGVLNVNQWNDTNDVFPFSLLQPPTIVGDTILIGWAGKDWAYTVEPPGNLMAVDARTGALLWDTGFIPEELIPPHRHGEHLVVDVGRPRAGTGLRSGLFALAELLGRKPAGADPAGHLHHCRRYRDGRDRLVLPAYPARHLGL